MNCINCGRPSSQFICPTCTRVGEENERLLQEGITVEYDDGTEEVFKDEEEPKHRP